jgi:hypothetical protein
VPHNYLNLRFEFQPIAHAAKRQSPSGTEGTKTFEKFNYACSICVRQAVDPLFAEISGTLGDIVFKRSSTGEMIITRRPRKSNKKPSEAQKAHRLRFKEATAYAKAILADPTARAHYEKLAAREGKAAYTLALADYMNGSPLLPPPNTQPNIE